MISLDVTIRKESGKKTNVLRRDGKIPAVVYGHNLGKNDHISVDEKEFRKIFKKAGESSLVELRFNGAKEKRIVLIHDVQKDPVSGGVIHIDFFQPNLKEEVEVAIPLVFEGIAPAEKDLGGTLVKNILEVQVKALPQNLPQSINVDVSSLNTFEDHILVKNLPVPQNVKIVKEPDEIVASVLAPQKVEEELAVPIEEKVEEVAKVEKEKKEEEAVEEE